MCYVTATQLKKNLSYYLSLAKNENVYVTKNNVVISVICNPQSSALKELKEIVDYLDIDNNVKLSDEEIIAEEIDKR